MERYGNMEFATKKELYKFLNENRDKLIAQKKAVIKTSDCPVIVRPVLVHDTKATKQIAGQVDSIKVVVIINTTNYLDSHNDLHLPGIWTKSLQENKVIMHLQEHEMEFDKIIADGKQLKAYTKTYNWSELGYSFKGTTEALVFESEILRKRNAYMLEQYANGWVRNHSVGMYYVRMDFAINDEEFPNEFEAWNKYYPLVANQDVADERGYFWYVLEAKCVEGSAVPIGSNPVTPTLEISNMTKCPECGNEFDYLSVPESGMGYVLCPQCQKPVTGKHLAPPSGTPEQNRAAESTHKIDYGFLLKNLKK